MLPRHNFGMYVYAINLLGASWHWNHIEAMPFGSVAVVGGVRVQVEKATGSA